MRLQTWVQPALAREIKELADQDGRSVSNLIRVALQDRLSSTSPSGEEAERPVGSGSSSRRSRSGAGHEEH